LPWGTRATVKVLATNNLGSSDYSQNGVGPIILTKPDTAKLVEDTSLRSPTTLGITWTAPTFNGGAAITDYLITFAKKDEDFSTTPTVVTDKNYKAENLIAENIYKFRI
jgi:hypothetical protein